MNRTVLRLSVLAAAIALSPAASALSFYPPVETRSSMYDQYNYRNIIAGEVADLDGDGRVEVLLAETNWNPGDFKLRQYGSDEAGNLVFERDDTLPGLGTIYSGHLFLARDIDGDGLPEIVVGDPYRMWIAILGRDADGRYSERVRLAHPMPEGGSDYPDVRSADLDRDGVLDVLVGGVGEVLHYRGLGDFTYAEPTHMLGYGYGPLAVGDIDGDQRPDLLAGTMHGALGFAFGATGAHRFRQMELFPREPSHYGSAVTTGDLDDDGVPEAVVAYVTYEYVGTNSVRQSWKLASYEAAGPQQLAEPTVRLVRDSINPLNLNLVVADFDRDGDDEAITRYNGRADVLTFEGGAMTVWQLPLVNFASMNLPFRNLFVADFTGDGCPDVAELGSFAFAVHRQRGGCGTAAPVTAPARKVRPGKIGASR